MPLSLKNNGIHKNLKIVEINLFIVAKTIKTLKKVSSLFSGSVNLDPSNLVYKFLIVLRFSLKS